MGKCKEKVHLTNILKYAIMNVQSLQAYLWYALGKENDYEKIIIYSFIVMYVVGGCRL